jgi:hypothetical protein
MASAIMNAISTPGPGCWVPGNEERVTFPIHTLGLSLRITYLLGGKGAKKEPRFAAAHWPPMRRQMERRRGRKPKNNRVWWERAIGRVGNLAAWDGEARRRGVGVNHRPIPRWLPYPWPPGVCPDLNKALVRHLCSNPTCYNPNHLALGTAKGNMLDRRIAARVGQIGHGALDAGLFEVLDTFDLDEDAKRYWNMCRNVNA